jgi:hypothetical protein
VCEKGGDTIRKEDGGKIVETEKRFDESINCVDPNPSDARNPEESSNFIEATKGDDREKR